MGVNFPIERTVVYNGEERIKRLEKGALVRCIFCGKIFRVDDKNTYKAKDGMPIIVCPEQSCRIGVPVLYYFDKEIRTGPVETKKKKKPKNKGAYMRVTDSNRTYAKKPTKG